MVSRAHIYPLLPNFQRTEVVLAGNQARNLKIKFKLIKMLHIPLYIFICLPTKICVHQNFQLKQLQVLSNPWVHDEE